MAKLHFGSKEYFEKQSEFWFKENSKHISERDAYKKQRDELINDMAEVKRKAEAFDKLKKHIDEEADSYMTLYRETKDPFYSLLNSHYDTLFGYMEELERADDER